MRQLLFAAAASAVLAGCGSRGEASMNKAPETGAGGTASKPNAQMAPAAPAAPAAMTMPAWMKVDRSKKMVSMDVEAGKTPDNNHWNYNGFDHGDATITVPEGYTVRLAFRNDDPVLSHSIGVDARTGDFPATMESPTPVFSGALSKDPTNPAGGVKPHESETLTFKADKPGHYSLVCYMPGHAAAGMWVRFDVAPDTSAGLTAEKQASAQ